MFACKMLKSSQRFAVSTGASSFTTKLKPWNGQSINLKRCAWTAVELNRDPKELRSKWPKASFDVDKMTALIDHDNHEMRKEMREFLSDPVFRPEYNISLQEEREVCSISTFSVLCI